jgi:hypothetical protein
MARHTEIKFALWSEEELARCDGALKASVNAFEQLILDAVKHGAAHGVGLRRTRDLRKKRGRIVSDENTQNN